MEFFLLLLIAFIIISILLILKLNSNNYKGKSGEKLVAERLDILNSRVGKTTLKSEYLIAQNESFAQ